MALLWLIYGIIHKAVPLIISNAIWIVFEAIVLAGAIICS